MLDPAHLVFIDETAVSTNMVRLGGRAPRGVRLIGLVPLYSKFKALLRKVAARTVPRLYQTIRSFVPKLTAQECANYFRHAGYASI
jgi:hypothetical protein